MHVYRFRIVGDTPDEFLREIEVGTSQTFLDLLNGFFDTVDLPRDAEANFFVSNNRWLKVKHIGQVSVAQNQRDMDDEDLRADERVKRMPYFEMKQARMKDFIEDPHQRILLEYDHPRLHVTYFIELMRALPGDDKQTYPRCHSKRGDATLPIIHTMPKGLVPDDEPEEKILPDLSRLAALDDVSEDEIESDINDMMEDQTFSKILAGKNVEQAAPRGRPKKEKPSKEEAPADEFGYSMNENEDEEDEYFDDDSSEGDDDYFGTDEEDFSSGFEISGGRRDDDDY
ncbi:MAG: hypothetical protein LWX70_08210 [Sphingobacteriia bacterium]|nr:hypothetical protein [Sphingobacteriia bacterium]